MRNSIEFPIGFWGLLTQMSVGLCAYLLQSHDPYYELYILHNFSPHYSYLSCIIFLDVSYQIDEYIRNSFLLGSCFTTPKNNKTKELLGTLNSN